MSALKSADGKGVDLTDVGLRLHGKVDINSCAASASNGEDALLVGVDVNEKSATENACVKGCRTDKAGLLIGGKHRLKLGVIDIVRVKDSHCVCHCYTVVTAESCASCTEKVAVTVEVEAFLFHIDRAVGVLQCNDVCVALKDYTGAILVACGSRLSDNDVVALVSVALKATCLCKVYEIVGDGLCITRSTGNFRKFFEKSERLFRRRKIMKI